MVKILADECIHQDLIEALDKIGFNVLTVYKANLKGVSDDSIFNFAIKSKRVLLTFDRGFGNFFRFNIKKSAGVVIVLIDQMEKKEIIRNTLSFFKNIKQKILKGKLIIIGKTKVRIRGF
jgi:predicted nuclease of predicted toxin-antitoxin system